MPYSTSRDCILVWLYSNPILGSTKKNVWKKPALFNSLFIPKVGIVLKSGKAMDNVMISTTMNIAHMTEEIAVEEMLSINIVLIAAAWVI